MADYTSNLKTWGATGTEYPDGYSYIEGEQPVDEWDNFILYNTVEDISSLIDLTNKRIESDAGTAHPSTPEPAHLSFRTDEERLFHYDTTASSWHGLLKVDGDTLQGTLDAGGNVITGIGKLELDGETDLIGNDISDSAGGKTIYDSTASHIPLSVLEQDAVTVTSGSHLSGGNTITLGGSITLSVDDDFLLNTGDTVNGELVGNQAEGSRYFTAENSTSGDRLSVESETDGDFLLVGYDSSAGAWEYGSALEYSPGNGIWTFKSNPTVEGDTIATQNYTNTQIQDDVISPQSNDWFSKQEGGTVPAGSAVPVGTFGLDDGETIKVLQSMLTEDGFTTPAPSGINLVLVVEGDDATSGPTSTILSGDGTTLYDDSEGTMDAPLAEYSNTSGGHQTVTIQINNGDYGQTGIGSEQISYGGYIARIV